MAQVYHLTGRCMRRSIIAAVASRETGVAIDADLATPASAGAAGGRAGGSLSPK